MHSFVVENPKKVKKAVRKIRDKIKIKILVKGDKVSVSGGEMDEFVGCEVLKAVDFGFDVEDALLLRDENFVLEFINIKEHTRRRNLAEVRARVIGKNGKARKTIEELTGGVMVVHANMVGLIVDSEHLDAACQAVKSLIQGAKHSNVFSYLEKQNAELRKFDERDLGLKNPKKDKI